MPPVPAPAMVPAPPPPPPAAEPLPAAAKPALAAIKTAAQESGKKAIPVAAILRKRMIPIAIAGLLAIGVFGTLLSRQSSQASQPKTDVPAIQPNIVVPSTPAPASQVPVPVQPDDAAQPQSVPQISTTSSVVEVKPAPAVILRGQVKPLWEAGKYAQALALVEAILVENPTLAEARAWKKKIRAAQE